MVNIKINSFMQKKVLIQVYFFLFILLNVVDFFNVIPNDLDFFKKILSWGVIGFVFYKVSITKLLIGKKHKFYDLLFIFSFSLMTIVKSLVSYVTINDITSSKFPVFYYILKFIPISNFLISITFLLGLIFTLILGISLVLNHSVKKKSFLYSFKLMENDNYYRYVLKLLITCLYLIFFSLIVFNFFMEWFALAVDSIILVFGLLYYMYLYITRHFENKVSNILNSISNSGNSFYYNLIEMFSDKKTFFIGISFILCLHLLVDIGVYFVPYLFGIQNNLYSNISSNSSIHQSIFSLFDFKEGLFFEDLSSINFDFMLYLGISIIYFLTFFMFCSFMFLPFYIFYKNIKKQYYKFNQVFSILFLTSVFFYIIVFCFTSLKVPIKMIKIDHINAKGVDFLTSSVINSINSFELLSVILIFFVLLGFLIFRFNKYKIYFEKLILIFVLLFFVLYISLFFISSVNEELNTIHGFLNVNANDFKLVSNQNHINFQRAYNDYLNDNYYKYDLNKNFKVSYINLNSSIVFFSDLRKLSGRFVEYSNSHNDYFLINVNNIDMNKKIMLENVSKTYISNNAYDFKNNRFIKKNFSIIYYLGKNFTKLEKVNSKNYKVSLSFEGDLVNDMFFIEDKNKRYKNSLLNSLNLVFAIIRFVLLSLFYFCGGIAFVLYFVRKNLFRF